MGKPGVWGQSPQRGPGQSPWSEGQGAKPPEAESFSVIVGCPKKVENVLQFYYLTTYLWPPCIAGCGNIFFSPCGFLWPPYVIGGHYIFAL